MVSVEQEWEDICEQMKNLYDDNILREYAKQIKPSIQNNAVILSVPNRFMHDWLRRKQYDSVIFQKFQELQPSLQRVDVRLQNYFEATPVSSKKEETTFEEFTTPSVAQPFEIHLNPSMTFETYIVGSSNDLATAAAKGVTEFFDSNRNPLFLHSSAGLGKTHLMNAIAWRVRECHPEKKVMYLSAEQFMYQYVKALRNDRNTASKTDDNISDFRDLFRSADILMIDDVQFMAGKEGTQREFFHTFNALIEQGKQIVLSSDSSPLQLKGIEDRLRTRMAQGLIVDIYPTTYEMRIGILQSKAEQWGAIIPKNVIEFLAEKITTNVRELEGALKRLIANAEFLKTPITLATTQAILKDVLNCCEKEITIESIQKQVCNHFMIKDSDLKSTRRDRNVARPRQIAMYLAKNMTSKSLPEIGIAFGRDHSTIIHAIRTIEDLIKTDADIAQSVDLLKRSIK